MMNEKYNIRKDDEAGVYLYDCEGDTYSLSYDVISNLEKYHGLSVEEAIEDLVKAIKSDIR